MFVDSVSEIRAGENLALEVAVKNRGFQEAEDTSVRVSIPELGITKRTLYGDLSPEDESHPDKEDTVSKRIFLKIPRDAPAGVYTIEIEAFNSDSLTTTTRTIVVIGVGEDSRVISAGTVKTFAAGEERTYSITIVNAGNMIRVYELTVESPSGLTVTADQSVVAVPAGTSRTIKFTVSAEEEGDYSFAVNVFSDGELVKKESFGANVEGKSRANGNVAVLITVILAIIFVVLLIVLIVLLTRRPEKSEDFGESYY